MRYPFIGGVLIFAAFALLAVVLVFGGSPSTEPEPEPDAYRCEQPYHFHEDTDRRVEGSDSVGYGTGCYDHEEGALEDWDYPWGPGDTEAHYHVDEGDHGGRAHAHEGETRRE